MLNELNIDRENGEHSQDQEAPGNGNGPQEEQAQSSGPPSLLGMFKLFNTLHSG